MHQETLQLAKSGRDGKLTRAPLQEKTVEALEQEEDVQSMVDRCLKHREKMLANQVDDVTLTTCARLP